MKTIIVLLLMLATPALARDVTFMWDANNPAEQVDGYKLYYRSISNPQAAQPAEGISPIVVQGTTITLHNISNMDDYAFSLSAWRDDYYNGTETIIEYAESPTTAELILSSNGIPSNPTGFRILSASP